MPSKIKKTNVIYVLRNDISVMHIDDVFCPLSGILHFYCNFSNVNIPCETLYPQIAEMCLD